MKFKNIKPFSSKKETHILVDWCVALLGGGQLKLNFSRYRFWMVPKLCFIKKVNISSCLQSLGHLAEFPPQSVYRINDSLFLS